MSRNKYPEETRKKILDAALYLFMTKGYDNTSIQNIMDTLGGSSKGAIYHHFKSKEEILEEVMQEMDKGAHDFLQSIKEDSSLTGYQKLKSIFARVTGQGEKEFPLQTAPDMGKNPQMLLRQLASVYDTLVPDFIEPMIKEGIADGSIQTEYPRELAEMISLLSILWLNPLIPRGEEKEEAIQRKSEFFTELMQKSGIISAKAEDR